jgi:membrane-bound ClpP family serine protease
MELFGWICTIMIVIGFILNSIGNLKYAIYVWIIGDIGWILYDISIRNYSHLALSIIIIIINVYGLYKLKENEDKSKKD